MLFIKNKTQKNIKFFKKIQKYFVITFKKFKNYKFLSQTIEQT